VPQPPNMNKMLKQVQEMQAEIARAQEEAEKQEVEASAGGGMVTVRVNGALQVLDIKIDPDAVDPEDVDMLQDMVQAAMNEALRSAQEMVSSRMSQVTGGLESALGGMGLPGL
jgi:nucleoid-associated protein EbfC